MELGAPIDASSSSPRRDTHLSPSSHHSSAPVLVNLSPMLGQEDQEPVFYPVDYDTEKELPPPPSTTAYRAPPAGIPPRTSSNVTHSPPVHVSSPPRPRTSSPPRSTARAPSPPRMSHPQNSAHKNDLPELLPAPPSRVVGQGYSASHPVPTVQGYRSEKAHHDEEAKKYAQMVEQRQKEAEERERQAAAMSSQESNGLSDTKELSGEESNVARTAKHKTDKPNANAGASEKARLMDQINANQRQPS